MNGFDHIEIKLTLAVRDLRIRWRNRAKDKAMRRYLRKVGVCARIDHRWKNLYPTTGRNQQCARCGLSSFGYGTTYRFPDGTRISQDPTPTQTGQER